MTESFKGGCFGGLFMVTSGKNGQQWYAYESTNVCEYIKKNKV